MIIQFKQKHPLSPSEVTPREIYEGRRDLIAKIAATAAIGSSIWELASREALAGPRRDRLIAGLSSHFSTDEKPTPFKLATSYNNFYEFGLDKGDPVELAHMLKPTPWTVAIEGEVMKPITIDLTKILKLAPLEERIYRLRCVEGWSMVIPWLGFPLSNLLKLVEFKGNAKYVEFTTLADSSQMPGLRSPVLEWPYVEGLRIDEAMHPLTLVALGMYGEVLPNQNGAPIRLVVPWKYGFKSAKSIVKIRITSHQPRTTWNRAAPHEYGFYSNVNPHVDHPRWSQASERRIGEDGFLQPKRKTLMFNGYDQVAGLYTRMDLKKFY